MAIMGFIFMPMLMKRQLHVAEADTPMDNLCRLLKGGMQLRLKTLLYDAGCSSEEFLTRRSWKLVCFTQIPDVVFTHTKRTNAKLHIHIH